MQPSHGFWILILIPRSHEQTKSIQHLPIHAYLWPHQHEDSLTPGVSSRRLPIWLSVMTNTALTDVLAPNSCLEDARKTGLPHQA
jgi:hypothetical protein